MNSELPKFRLWDPNDAPAWVQEAISNDVDHGVRLTRLANLDLLFSLWVSKAVSTGNGDVTLRTFRLVEDASLDDFDGESINFDPDGRYLPEVAFSLGNIVKSHICEGHAYVSAFICRPWLTLNNGEIDNLIRGDSDPEYLDLTTHGVLLYLENFLPWDKEPCHRRLVRWWA